MKNIDLAGEILRSLWDTGVRDVIICAGARNAPFVSQLSAENPFKVHAFFEERSAGFFALGKIISTGRPVAVITTSGTAAANLLPAIIESDYQGQPLIAVTADRPVHYRGSGAPQTINQVGLYSHYVEKFFDIENSWNDQLDWSMRRPVHINVCFDEPLIDSTANMVGASPNRTYKNVPFAQAADTERLAEVHLPGKHPLILVGGLPPEFRNETVAVLKKWRRPVVLEGPSNLRGHPELSDWEIFCSDKTLKELQIDSVIRIGSVPTLRFWRDLEKSDLPVTHFSHLPFSGLPRSRQVHSLASLQTSQAQFTPWSALERDLDRKLAVNERGLLRRFSKSEPAWLEWLSREIPADARVFVGNSLPIREWDFAAVRDGRREIFANRGANGIDGLISTFLGLAVNEKSNWCILGDLSALYDLSGPWPNRQEKILDLNLVVINNSGGKIFKRMFHNSLFENPHDLNFKAWAEMWGWEYKCLREPESLARLSSGPRVIEIVPGEIETENFWKAWEAMK
ncbi:MAG: 2-succinyl-5-enolpyruvyl-6-hydroxy-3-cyclohexene-1-carboxylic-acid synthase [Bdellovibrionales bacterium]